MKQNLRFLMLTLLCAVFSTAWGDTTYKLEQVTSVEAGGLYVFEQDGYVMNNTVSSNALQTTNSYSMSGLSGTETYVWTLETATNGFYLKNVSLSSNQYLNGSSGKTNVSFSGKNTIWKFTFQTDETVVIQNTNGERFLGYTDGNSHEYKAYAASNLSGSTYPHAIKVYQLVEQGENDVNSPTFDPVTGTNFYGSQTITISSSTDGATIYYTINGNEPTTSSTEYLAPFTIEATTTIKAIAVKDGATSPVATATYTKLTPSISFTNTNINVAAAGGDGTINVTYGGIESQELVICDASGSPATYDWLDAELNSDNNIYYVVNENTSSTTRNAYFQVKGQVSENNFINSELITITQAAPVVSSGNIYTKVTSRDNLTNGSYLIVYEGALVAFDGNLGTLDAVSNTVDIGSIDNHQIEGNTEIDNATFDITYGYIKSNSGKYIGRTAGSNGFNQSNGPDLSNTVDFDEDGNVIITASGGCTLRFNIASNQARFRYYGSGQEAIQLYKKIESAASYNITIGSTGYATLYNGMKNLVVPANVKATTYKANASGGIEESTVYNAGNVIPAGEAVVLHDEEYTTGEEHTYEFVVTNNTNTRDLDNVLHGRDNAGPTFAPDAGSYKFYMLSLDANDENVGFYFYDDKGSEFESAAHKAYLALPKSSTPAQSFSFDDLNAIHAVIAAQTTNGEIYSISGVRMNATSLPKGIYIVNGKKVIIK